MPDNPITRDELDHAIEQLDQRLRDHVTQSMEQYQAQTARALTSANRLEEERFQHVHTAATHGNGVPLREYVEALMDEHKRALELGEREREKAANALREQLQRAVDKADSEREKSASALRLEAATAESEREKAARALAVGMERAMKEGDERLREHIEQQVHQITSALSSADKLELARVSASEEKTDAIRRELLLMQEAAGEAIDKAEKAAEKRFESVNEFRGQLADQVATFLPRETFDSVMSGWAQWRSSIDLQLASRSGGDAERTRKEDTTSRTTSLGIAAFGVVLTLLSLVLVIGDVITK